jgi:hypothetical protein
LYAQLALVQLFKLHIHHDNLFQFAMFPASNTPLKAAMVPLMTAAMGLPFGGRDRPGLSTRLSLNLAEVFVHSSINAIGQATHSSYGFF